MATVMGPGNGCPGICCPGNGCCGTSTRCPGDDCPGNAFVVLNSYLVEPPRNDHLELYKEHFPCPDKSTEWVSFNHNHRYFESDHQKLLFNKNTRQHTADLAIIF